MSARQIKAMDTPRNARIEVTTERRGVERTIRGLVNNAETTGDSTWITFRDNRAEEMHCDHPVTVLAEPEPEWVEGAWYQVAIATGVEGPMRRVPGGWSPVYDGSNYSWPDGTVTVLGRVLIVDWPGDDVARELKDWPANNALMTAIDDAAAKVADAIRTQGGVR